MLSPILWDLGDPQQFCCAVDFNLWVVASVNNFPGP